LKGGVEARVSEEDGKWLVLNANHHLAGQDIHFAVQVKFGVLRV
jgi:FKBP-type peptidyl-prolyl cis-trans isomerase 2